jgi:hypothetical protein
MRWKLELIKSGDYLEFYFNTKKEALETVKIFEVLGYNVEIIKNY